MQYLKHSCGMLVHSESFILDGQEIQLVYDYLSKQYIDYENTQLIELVKQMRVWLSGEND